MQRESAGQFKLGIDLKGGTSFLLELDTTRLAETNSPGTNSLASATNAPAASLTACICGRQLPGNSARATCTDYHTKTVTAERELLHLRRADGFVGPAAPGEREDAGGDARRWRRSVLWRWHLS